MKTQFSKETFLTLLRSGLLMSMAVTSQAFTQAKQENSTPKWKIFWDLSKMQWMLTDTEYLWDYF